MQQTLFRFFFLTQNLFNAFQVRRSIEQRLKNDHVFIDSSGCMRTSIANVNYFFIQSIQVQRNYIALFLVIFSHTPLQNNLRQTWKIRCIYSVRRKLCYNTCIVYRYYLTTNCWRMMYYTLFISSMHYTQNIG